MNIRAPKHIAIITNSPGKETYRKLRYTLRSIEQFYPGQPTVWLVGFVPAWATGIKQLRYPGNGNRYRDSFEKAAHAVYQLPAGPVTFFHDDMYLLQPYIPRKYFDMKLTARAKRTGGDRAKVFENTIELLGQDALNFALHYPMPVNTTFAKPHIFKLLREYDFISWFNYFGALSDEFPKVKKQDQKFYKHIPLTKLQGPAFSTAGEGTSIWQSLEKIYPQQSKYEKSTPKPLNRYEQIN